MCVCCNLPPVEGASFHQCTCEQPTDTEWRDLLRLKLGKLLCWMFHLHRHTVETLVDIRCHLRNTGASEKKYSAVIRASQFQTCIEHISDKLSMPHKLPSIRVTALQSLLTLTLNGDGHGPYISKKIVNKGQSVQKIEWKPGMLTKPAGHEAKAEAQNFFWGRGHNVWGRGQTR